MLRLDDELAQRDRSELLEILVRSSFLQSDTPSFKLSSGKLSNYYVDCKMAMSHPRARQLAGRLILQKLAADVDVVNAVGGLALGAYPIATAVSDVAWRDESKNILAFIVRREPKKHGLEKYLEGDVQAGQRVLIVDDVITSGGSTIEAIDKSLAGGLEVVRAIGLIDRQEENGRENIEARGIQFDSLFILKDLIGMADSLAAASEGAERASAR